MTFEFTLITYINGDGVVPRRFNEDLYRIHFCIVTDLAY